MFIRLMHSKWLQSLAGVLLLSLLIWVFGPLLGLGQAHPLDSEIVRFIVIGLMLVLWLVVNLMRELKDAKRDKGLVDAATTGPDPDQTASAEEVAVLTGRLKEALQTLRKSKLGGRSGRRLYQLPWYMFIGPPGAGKTTALANSGLRFPLADTGGPGLALAGVGGTRNCDWWFTDQAVLIDTAGRYTTQDSHAAVDSAAWTGFLKLLKKHRARQPLNGVIVAISLSDLSVLGDEERGLHARAIRKRLRELQDELGVRIPVYVLFTKADLIAGFIEFFDGLDREGREQVWGITFPLDAGAKDGGKTEGGAVSGFAPEFDLLMARLNDRMMERVNAETDIQRRRLIYGFPLQVASLRGVATDFLDEIFRPSRLEARPLLRGVYLASGTQDGTPIDRLLGTMAGQFGLGRQSVVAFSGAGRSYFLSRLVRDVVFGEAGLVSQDPKVERRARLIQWGAIATAVLLLLLLTGIWTVSYFGNRDMIAQVQSEAATYNAQLKELATRPPNDTDLLAVLPPLHTLRTMRGGYDDRAASAPLALTFGLYQGEKLTSAAVDAYYRALNGLLLPRLLARLESQMQSHTDKPDFLYSALKTYLILGRQGPLDADLVMQWLQADLEAAYPGDDNAEQRAALLGHAEAMLQRPLTAIPLNGPMVSQVRGILTQQPIAEYSYNRMLRSRRLRALPEWTVADNAGPGAGRVFQLRSGRRLTIGVPGVFTYSGYHNAFLPLLPTVTQDIAEDGWVLGLPDRGLGGTLAETNRLRHDVLGLYLDDYVRVWDAMLADVSIKPFTSLAAGVDELNLLSAPDSPLRDLLQGVDGQTQLTRTGATGKAEASAENALTKAGKRAAGFAGAEARTGLTQHENELAQVLSESFGNDSTTGKPVDPASRVDQHFKWVHDFVNGSEGQTPPMEAAIGKIQTMYQNLNQAASASNPGQALLSAVAGGGGGGGGGGAAGAAAQLKSLAGGLPKPIAGMLETVSNSGAAVATGGASTELSDAWRSKVLPLCNAAFNRYPFIAGSTADVPLDDFSRLLGPGGLMDAFFNDNLKPLVNTASTPWQWQAADHASLGLSPATLTEFERAADIRDAMFAGGSQIQVKFELVPVSLDPRIAKISIDISGQTMSYDHGPIESQGFAWPANGKTTVRVTITPTGGGHETTIEKNGPWSLLRLLDGRVIPSGQPDSFKLSFSSPQGAATFALNASSVRNPFTMSAIRSFRCPAHL